MVISRRRFVENLKEMHEIKKKHVTGVQNFCFCQLSMQILWRRRCSLIEPTATRQNDVNNVVGDTSVNNNQHEAKTTLVKSIGENCFFWTYFDVHIHRCKTQIKP